MTPAQASVIARWETSTTDLEANSMLDDDLAISPLLLASSTRSRTFVTAWQDIIAGLGALEDGKVKFFGALPVHFMATGWDRFLNNCLARNFVKKKRVSFGARDPIIQMPAWKLDVVHFDHTIAATLTAGLVAWMAARVVSLLTIF